MVAATVTSTKSSLGTLYDPALNLLAWEGDLAVGEMVTVTFDAEVNDTATPGLALINLAAVDGSNAYGVSYSSALTEILETFHIYLPLIFR